MGPPMEFEKMCGFCHNRLRYSRLRRRFVPAQTFTGVTNISNEYEVDFECENLQCPYSGTLVLTRLEAQEFSSSPL